MLHPAAEFRGRFRGDAAEAAIEMGQALEADIVSHLGDAGGGLHQHALGFFHACAIHKVREGEAGGTLEELAEMEGAHVHRLGDGFEGHRLGEMLVDEGLRVAHGLGLMRGGRKKEAVGAFPELQGKGLQDGDGGIVALRSHDRGGVEVNLRTADFRGGAVFIEKGLRDGGEGVRIRGLEADSAGEHEGDDILADLHRHFGFHDTGDAGAGDHAFVVAVFRSRLKAQRQAGEGVERLLVMLEELAFGERAGVLLDPAEERIKSEFDGVKRSFLPMHSVLRIDEVTKRGAFNAISASLQQLAGGVSAAVAGAVILEAADGTILHFNWLGYIVVCTTLASLALMYFVHKQVPEPAGR